MEAIHSQPEWTDLENCPHLKPVLILLEKKEDLHDIFFLVGDEDEENEYVGTHKIVLALKVKYLVTVLYPENHNNIEDLFLANLKNNSLAEFGKITFHLEGVNKQAFKIFLQFLYRSTIPEMEIEMAFKVLSLAQSFRVEELLINVMNVIRKVADLSVMKAIMIYQLSVDRIIPELQKYCIQIFCKDDGRNFHEPAFLKLEEVYFASLLRNDEMNIKEKELFLRTMEWGYTQCNKRRLQPTNNNLRDVVKNLIPLIRFSLMTSKEYFNVVRKFEILTPEETDEIQCYYIVKSWQDGSVFNTSSRKFNYRPRVATETIDGEPSSSGSPQSTDEVPHCSSQSVVKYISTRTVQKTMTAHADVPGCSSQPVVKGKSSRAVTKAKNARATKHIIKIAVDRPWYQFQCSQPLCTRRFRSVFLFTLHNKFQHGDQVPTKRATPRGVAKETAREKMKRTSVNKT